MQLAKSPKSVEKLYALFVQLISPTSEVKFLPTPKCDTENASGPVLPECRFFIVIQHTAPPPTTANDYPYEQAQSTDCLLG